MGAGDKASVFQNRATHDAARSEWLCKKEIATVAVTAWRERPTENRPDCRSLKRERFVVARARVALLADVG